jgi:hypothetical protein
MTRAVLEGFLEGTADRCFLLDGVALCAILHLEITFGSLTNMTLGKPHSSRSRQFFMPAISLWLIQAEARG